MWGSAIVFFWTPIPTMVFWNNLIWYTYDFVRFYGDDTKTGMRPSMYDNFFTRLIMGQPGTIVGIFAFWDIFTFSGFNIWLRDCLATGLLFPIELYRAYQRNLSLDWNKGRRLPQNVDRNRIRNKRVTREADPFDFNYWSSKPDGVDCNGAVGVGYYCYCPSQGYQCSCRPKDVWPEGQVRNMCNDHYGYDCTGNFVDGENNWCQDTQSIYWYLNQ